MTDDVQTTVRLTLGRAGLTMARMVEKLENSANVAGFASYNYKRGYIDAVRTYEAVLKIEAGDA